MLEVIWWSSPPKRGARRSGTAFTALGVRIVQARFEELEPPRLLRHGRATRSAGTAGIDAAVVRYSGESRMQRVPHRIMERVLRLSKQFGDGVHHANEPLGDPFLAHAPTRG